MVFVSTENENQFTDIFCYDSISNRNINKPFKQTKQWPKDISEAPTYTQTALHHTQQYINKKSKRSLNMRSGMSLLDFTAGNKL